MDWILKKKALNKTIKEYVITKSLIKKLIKTPLEKAIEKYIFEDDKEQVKKILGGKTDEFSNELRPFFYTTLEGRLWFEINSTYNCHYYTLKFCSGQ